jgi:hypothetical protein
MYFPWRVHQDVLALQVEGKTTISLAGNEYLRKHIKITGHSFIPTMTYDYTYVVDGHEHKGSQDGTDPVGQLVTYLPSNPKTHQVGVVNSAVVRNDFWGSLGAEGFLVVGFLGLLFGFCFPSRLQMNAAHAPGPHSSRRYVLLGEDGSGGIMYWDD